MAYDPWDLSAYGKPSTSYSNYTRSTNPVGDTRLTSPSGNVHVDLAGNSATNPQTGNPWKIDLANLARAGSNIGTPPSWPQGGYPPGPGPGGGGSRRGGGGGGGMIQPDWDKLNAIMNWRPKEQTWTDVNLPEYKPPQFYGFNDAQYTTMKNYIAERLGMARQQGAAAYGEARGQINATPMGFQSAPTTTDPGMSAAMQRMYAANGVPTSVNEATMNEGVQADRAFGNLYAILGENARQGRASDLRALAGDERRMGEELATQEMNANLSVDMALARAREQYEKEKWAFGEDVARTNWQTRQAEIMYNAQGRQQTANNNVDAWNAAQGGNVSTLIDMIASGLKPPDLMILHQSGYPSAAAPAEGAA